MLWVGQFGIVGGQVQEESPWVGIFPDHRQGDPEAADLYLLVEPALPGSEEFCGELAAAIGTVFHQRRLSLTGGLLRALRAAHEDLRQWNRRSLREHRVAAGISCLALRGRQGYLAQVAPACALLRRAGSPCRLEPTLPDAGEPLGLHDEFWPHFRRLELAPGDRLLLLSPVLAAAVDRQELERALSLPPQDLLPTLYRAARGAQGGGALLLALTEEASQ